MHVLTVRNVNYALPEGVELIREQGRPVAPRGQPTLEVPEPVATAYELPSEKVLFSEERDANPFLHFFEALWLLAGRNDVAFVTQFLPRLKEYSDNGRTFHGAYGYRLRQHFGRDQLKDAADRLRREPTTRQVVLQIWSCKDDLNVTSKDLPCNDTIALKIRDRQLHLTVFCRSNDIVWGAYGVNAVQFATLGEYLAGQAGVALGTYTQVSDSFHAYTEREDWARIKDLGRGTGCPYVSGHVKPYPLMDMPARFDADLHRFLEDPLDELGKMFPTGHGCRNSFIWGVAEPLYRAWVAHKANKSGAKALLDCRATDWRHAALAWLARRGDRLSAEDERKLYAQS